MDEPVGTKSLTMTTDESIEVFLDELDKHGRSRRTLDAYERVLEAFTEHIRDNSDSQPTSLEYATRSDCLSWIDSLRGTYAESTVATYATYVNRFYRYMNEIGTFDSNPMTLVMEGLDEGINTDPTRRELSVDDLRSFIRQINHPLHHAIILMLAKTGIRVGELVNLDLRDITLESIDVDESYGVLPRGQLVGRGPSMFVSNDPTRGSTYNGEPREASNKRERDTIIPIDDELERAIVHWLRIRPDVGSSAQPLFVSTKHDWGQRLTTDKIQYMVRSYAKAADYYATEAEAGENVTPHYFRHFFTTHLRDRTGDRGIVKYLRGDVAEDIIDTYTHNWGDRVRANYEAHIYQLTA